MNRRTLLKNTGLLAAGVIGLPAFRGKGADRGTAGDTMQDIDGGADRVAGQHTDQGAAGIAARHTDQGAVQTVSNAGYFATQLGDLELLIVTDGHSIFSPAQPMFAPGIPAADFEAILQRNFLPAGAVDISFNVLVIKKGKDIILFDTGCGINFGPQSGKLPENLRAAGIDPAEVTVILLTHAHPDHVGGLLDKEGRAVFPHAALYVAAPEYDFWTGEKPDFSKSKYKDHTATTSWVALATKGFAAYRDRLHFFHDRDEVLEGIRARVVPGHTPGHTLFTISSGEETIVHMGDTAHDHVVLLSHPEWGVGFDTDFEEAAQARRKILGELAAGRQRVFSFHLPWPGLGHIRARDKGYEWVVQAFATV